MAQFRPLFLDTGSIETVSGSRIVDYMHFPVTRSISSSYSTNLPDPYLFVTTSANITNAVNTTSSSLFEFRVPGRQENYFYTHTSIVGVTTSATTTGVRIGIQRDNRPDAIANIRVSSTLTAHTIACVGSQVGTTFALPASMAAINTVYPCFVKGLYTNSTASVPINNIILLQPETNNTVTGFSGSVSYNKFIGYESDLLDRSLNIGTGFLGGEYPIAIALQNDGKILLGGVFTSYNGTTQGNITRLNSDGTRDTSFTIGTGFNAEVNAIALQNDGKIVVVGSFTSYNGVSQNYITRLNSDGTRDTSFTIGTGFDAFLLDVIIQNDGKILPVGAFSSYSGSVQNYITRLNSNGTIDTGFDGIVNPFNGSIRKVVIQSDGKIVVAGEFSGPFSRIARLNTNGSLDTTFLPPGPTGGGGAIIRTMHIQKDDKVIIAGDFTAYSGFAGNICRLNLDASYDDTFNTGGGFGILFPDSIVAQEDEKLVVVGGYTFYSGSNCNYIVRLNTDGTLDEQFNSYPSFPNDAALSPLVVAIQTNKRIITGGLFEFYNRFPKNGLVRLLPELNINQTSTPLYLSTGSLKQISGSDTVTSSFLPVTSSLWLSQSLSASVSNSSATVYSTVFSLPGLATNKTYLANLYMIGVSAAAATGFRMRVVTGSSYRGTLYTPTSTTAPAIQNSANANNITSVTAGTWPTLNTKYLVYGEYTFVKGATDPQVQILSETAGTAVTAISGSVIYYRAID